LPSAASEPAFGQSRQCDKLGKLVARPAAACEREKKAVWLNGELLLIAPLPLWEWSR